MEEAPIGSCDPARAVPADRKDGEATTKNPSHKAYPVRWLCEHYSLSPAVAKIVAAELHMGGSR